MLHPTDEVMHPRCRKFILKVKIINVKVPEIILSSPHITSVRIDVKSANKLKKGHLNSHSSPFISEWMDRSKMQAKERVEKKRKECAEYKRTVEKTDDGWQG